MPTSPDTKNYTLGKGIPYFNRLDPATGLYTGLRDLGNAPALTFNVSLETLEHFSSRGGAKKKDKKIISSVTPMINFTLDEVNADNIALTMMSEVEDMSQVAADDNSQALTSVMPGVSYDLDKRGVGIKALGYDGGTVIHKVGATLTGGTSAATATIVQVIGTAASGTLYLKDVSGTFENNEVLADDDATPGASVANGVVAVLTTTVSVEDTDDAGTFFTVGTDFTINAKAGMLTPIVGGGIDGTTVTNLTIVYSNDAIDYKLIKGLKNTELEGAFRFVSDNPAGNDMQLDVWRLSLTPAGDTAMIGDNWSTLAFEGEVLADETGHPDSPYLDITVVPVT